MSATLPALSPFTFCTSSEFRERRSGTTRADISGVGVRMRRTILRYYWHAVTYPNGPLRSLCVLCVLTSHPPGPTCAPASRPTCMGNALASSEYSTQHLSREVEVGVHVSCHALSLSTYLSSLSLPALARCQVRMVLQ